MGRSRGGLTTKIHALVDANGLPLRFDLTGGQVHDSQAAAKLLDDLQPDCFVLADKAYDANWIRQQIGRSGRRCEHPRSQQPHPEP